MNTLTLYRCCCTCLLCAGFGLAMLALLLHPVNPDDFLRLAFVDPLATLASPYGLEAATLFWIGAALALAGLAGMMFPPRGLGQALPAGGYATSDGEDAARLWSYR